MTTPSPAIDPEPVSGKPRRRRRFWPLLALAVSVPVCLTLIGALSSPPHEAGVPVGRLLYLEADEPSEHTTLLRGLFLAQPGSPPRLLVHETEPQDTDAGAREWITQPAASPDGRQVAFEKQLITLQEEQHSIVHQIWAMALNDPRAQPRLLLDLTQHKLKPFVGLAWTPDSRSVVFLEDSQEYRVRADGGPAAPSRLPLRDVPPLTLSPDLSATRSPILAPDGSLTYFAAGPAGPSVIFHGRPYRCDGPFFSDGRRLVLVDRHQPNRIVAVGGGAAPVPIARARWGWSVFGGRRITSLRGSPDGRFLAYSVSKRPVPDDELFSIDLATGAIRQLPFRAGPAAWDWTR